MKQFLCLKGLIMDDGERSLTAGKLYQACDKEFTGVWNDDGRPHYGISLYGSWVETFEKDGHTWIRHSGGDCPVPDGWKVEVLFNCGETNKEKLAGYWGWLYDYEYEGAINAYRIISTGEQVACDDVRRHTESVFERYSGTFDRLATMASILVPESITAVEPSPGPDYGAKIKADVSESGNVFVYEENDELAIAIDPESWKGWTDVDVLHFTQQEFKRHSDSVLGVLEDVLHKEKDSRPLSPQGAAYAEKMAAIQPEPEAPKVFPAHALRDMSDKTFANLLGMNQFIGGGE